MFYFTIFVFIVFGTVDYYITEVQHNIVEEATNYYLNRMKFLGTLYESDKVTLINELSNKGFKNLEVIATDGYGNTLDDNTIIFRNSEEPTSSTLILYVKAEPYSRPFIFGKLLGAEEKEKFYFNVKRRSISERANL